MRESPFQEAILELIVLICRYIPLKNQYSPTPGVWRTHSTGSWRGGHLAAVGHCREGAGLHSMAMATKEPSSLLKPVTRASSRLAGYWSH